MIARLRHQAVYIPVLALLVSMFFSSLARIGLLVITWKNINHDFSELLSVFLNGFAGDLLFGMALAGFFLIFTALSHSNKPCLLIFKGKRIFAVLLLIAFLLFVFISEFIFWEEFGARFNFVAVDYLIYTNEVIGNIRESYSMPLVFGGMLLSASLLGALVLRFWKLAPGKSFGLASRFGTAILGATLLYLVGSLSLNYADRTNSQNQFNQEISHNGPASFFLAARENKLDFKRYYRTLPDKTYKALAPKWPDPDRDKPSLTPLNPKHVILIEIESFSASFMKSYGSEKAIAPNLDQLVHEGIWFSNLYATGTRTVRGLEAMSAALPPLPGQSIVRRSNNSDLYTLGGMLRKKSFDPMFMYGGYGVFDNMNAYFRGNGYAIKDRSDFSEANNSFATVWGVADELLFNEAIDQIDYDTKNGTKRFLHIMTTSNHRPYTYPAGRIDIPSKTGRDGAVKYTDWAIGNFLRQARKKPWFNDTLFIIVADHNASVAGKQSLPPNKYLIPAVLYAPKMIASTEIKNMSSQIDLTPTVLAMLGIHTNGVFFGQNLLALNPEQRAFLVNYQELGYLTPSSDGLRHLTLLGPKKRLENYSVSADGDLTKVPDDSLNSNKAIALFQRVDEVYSAGEYRP